jgi:hypothetical protein
MPYRVHTKDGNPYCVEKTSGEDVGCASKETIGGYLSKLNSVAEEELEEGFLDNNIKKGKDVIERGKAALWSSLNDTKIQTSNVYKSLNSGKQLTPEEKKELMDLLTKIGSAALFLLPFGSIPFYAIRLFKKHKDKIKNKEKEPEEIMENKLVGGRADNETIKDVSKKFRVPVKYLKQQLKKGMKVESEHTNDEEKQEEIATDHLAEFPNYYEELEGVEKKLKDYWDEKLGEDITESKLFIKKLLRENIEQVSIEQQIDKQIQDLGYNRDDVNLMIDNEMQNEGLGDVAKKIFNKFKTTTQAVAKPLIVCSVLAGGVSCTKNNPHVYKFSFNIDKLVTYTLKQDVELGNNLKLKAGQQFGIMDGAVYNPKNNTKLPEHMQKEIFDFIKNKPDLFTNNLNKQYNPQEQVGSWYILEKDKLSDAEIETMEDKLAADEKIELTGKDYTIIAPTAELEYMGQSKRGDIETK